MYVSLTSSVGKMVPECDALSEARRQVPPNCAFGPNRVIRFKAPLVSHRVVSASDPASGWILTWTVRVDEDAAHAPCAGTVYR